MSARHRRRNTTDRTRNIRRFTITGSWDNNPDEPARWITRDPKETKRVARSMAAKGAYVIVEELLPTGAWETWFELDGPAIVAEQNAIEATLAAAWPPAPTGYRPDADDRHRTWLVEQGLAEHRRAQARAQAEALAAEQAARRRRIAAELANTSRQLMSAPPEARPDYRRAARHMTGAQR
ncbi:hypothetical protein OG357_23080 [Streptomyces sp. NBC_01255]|uniref:hypothetical protein n=1 Tax=Streptomyces sp. NBC_01255 TaxID=2903798 RepID=UPI002E337021|nr:hypothetical protein [Streptomyces sp. NBC_01255]